MSRRPSGIKYLQRPRRDFVIIGNVRRHVTYGQVPMVLLRKVVVAWSLLVPSVLWCCGGHVTGREPDENAGGASGGPAESAGEPDEWSFDLIDLPPCEPGFNPAKEPGRFCAYVGTDGLCYDSKEDACACLCRESNGTSCLSPFLDAPPSRIPVSCL